MDEMTTTPQDDRKQKLWQSVVLRAVQTAQQRGKPSSVEAILDSCGVFRWAPYRSQAHEFVTKLLAAKECKR